MVCVSNMSISAHYITGSPTGGVINACQLKATYLSISQLCEDEEEVVSCARLIVRVVRSMEEFLKKPY